MANHIKTLSVFERIGQVVAVATLSAALSSIGANFNSVKVPLTYSVNGKTHTSKTKVAVTRADTGEELGIMGPKYHTLDNMEAFGILDHIAKESGATYERAGKAKGKYFVTLRLPFSVSPTRRPDDTTELFYSMFNCFDGSCDVIGVQHSRRLVCSNMFASVMRNADFSFKRSSLTDGKLWGAQTEIAFAIAEQQVLQAKVDRLEGMAFTASEMETFAKRLFPVAEDKVTTKHENRVAELVRLFSSEATGNLGRSRYDALNAVTEYTDHYAPTRATDSATAEENRFESVFFGQSSDLKRKAADLLLA